MWLITSCFGRRDNFNKYSSSITPVGHMDLNKSGKYDKERVRTNMLKQFVPSNHEMPMILQFIQKMPSKMKAMLAA